MARCLHSPLQGRDFGYATPFYIPTEARSWREKALFIVSTKNLTLNLNLRRIRKSVRTDVSTGDPNSCNAISIIRRRTSSPKNCLWGTNGGK